MCPYYWNTLKVLGQKASAALAQTRLKRTIRRLLPKASLRETNLNRSHFKRDLRRVRSPRLLFPPRQSLGEPQRALPHRRIDPILTLRYRDSVNQRSLFGP